MTSDSREDQRSILATLPVIASVASAILVAWISHTTSLDVAKLEQANKQSVAELERETRRDTVQIEQVKFREQQETRRIAFLEKHIPALLSSNEIERRAAITLVRMTYPSEAADILSQLLPVATGAARPGLQQDLKDAESLSATTSDWTIVVSGDKSLDFASKWMSNLSKLGLSPARIYFRDDFYRVTAGSYPSRLLAEQAAIAIRPQTRLDAYVVSVGTWCPAVESKFSNKIEIYTCKNK